MLKSLKISAALLLLASVLFFACVTAVEAAEDIPPGIAFTEAGVFHRGMGFPVTAIVNGREYLFRADDEGANAEFIITTENLIRGIGNITDKLSPPDRLYEPVDREQYIIGAFVQQWSEPRLPFWLSAAIEAMARAEFGLFEPATLDMPDNFGDLSFMPHLRNTVSHNNAINAAYYFGRYIQGAGRLAELIGLYLSGEKYTADNLAHGLFNGFYGDAVPNFAPRLEIGDERWDWMFDHRFGESHSHRVVMSGDLSDYYFAFRTLDEYNDHFIPVVSGYIELMDKAIAFTFDWFYRYAPYAGITEFNFAPVRTGLFLGQSEMVDWAGGILVDEDTQAIFLLERFLPYHTPQSSLTGTTVHEVVHILSMRHAHYTWSTTWEEGLAGALVSIFNRQQFPESLELSAFNAFLRFGGNEEFARSRLGIDASLLEDDAVLYAVQAVAANRALYGIGVHTTAYMLLNHFETAFTPERRQSTLMHRRNFTISGALPFANCYDTSRSFVLFLLDTYGAEKYMQVHYTPENFGYVYGITAYEMVERWKRFLVDTTDSVIAEVMYLLLY